MKPVDQPAPDPALGLPVHRFSTAGLAPRRRHEAWTTQGWPSVGRAVEAVGEPGFGAEAETVTVGPLAVIYGRYGGQTVRRTRNCIRREPAGHLNVALPLSAQLEGDWGVLGPGEIGVIDTAAQWQHRSTSGALISIAVPRPLAIEHGLDPRALHGATVGKAAAALLRSHLLQLRRAAATVRPADGERLAGTVVDLLAVALGAAGWLAAPLPAAARTLKLRAEQLIAAGAADPALNPAALAQALGVSRATLYRLFASEGGVQRRIRAVRLGAAAAALDAGEDTVVRIAEQFGFGDASHFGRVFRAAYGVAPGNWRAGERAG